MAELLRYDRVEITYNDMPAVKDISFSVAEGEILGIAGESGSGKSTLLRAAMGLLEDTGLVAKGDIWYQGRNLPDLRDEERRRLNGPHLGMIFQSAGSSFCPIRTVGAQMYESLRAHAPITREAFTRQALDLLVRIGFDDGQRILDSYPFELSGGMQQRVGIAAAVLLSPKVLLADEPTAALDAAVQRQVVEELLLIRKTFGTAIVFVTHHIGLIEKMADRVLVMKDGERVEYGDTIDILHHPKAAYTKRLLAAVPRLRR